MTLSLVAISVVFGCLLFLFVIYSILGGFFSGMIRLPRRASRPPRAAKAPADEAEVAAAIAMALQLHLAATAHDAESGIITIRPNPDSQWNNKSLAFRQSPKN